MTIISSALFVSMKHFDAILIIAKMWCVVGYWIISNAKQLLVREHREYPVSYQLFYEVDVKVDFSGLDSRILVSTMLACFS